MKVRITLDLDVPTDGYSVEDIKAGMLEQNVWDDTLSYMRCRHAEDVVRWIVLESKAENAQEKLGAKMIAKHHETWADILSDCAWKFEVL